MERYRILGGPGTVWKFLYHIHGNTLVLLKEIGGAPERYDGMGFPGEPERYGTVWKLHPIGNGMEISPVYSTIRDYC